MRRHEAQASHMPALRTRTFAGAGEVMRDYGQIQCWTNSLGQTRPVVSSRYQLNFRCPSHSELRKFVFHRDNFSCLLCGAKAVNIPIKYDGRKCLETDTFVKSKKSNRSWPDILVVDHIVTRRAGGTNHPNNLQTLCETCNKRKQKEDKAAAAAFSESDS